jgi:hypothetical protein
VGTHVVTRRAAVKRPRDRDTGHVVTGIGFAFECSCGERGKVRPSWNAAMQDGREHAAEHDNQQPEEAWETDNS